jgi:hypothetical protein
MIDHGVSDWSLAIGFWLLVIGYWFLVIGYVVSDELVS